MQRREEDSKNCNEPPQSRFSSFQLRSVEVAQDKMINAVTESGKSQIETLEAILGELRLNREEMKQGREEMKHGREENLRISKEVRDFQVNILNEIQVFKEDSNRQLRESTRAFKDATSEISTLCDDITRQFKTLISAVKASRFDNIVISACTFKTTIPDLNNALR